MSLKAVVQILGVVTILLLMNFTSFADEVKLKNGDKISGQIIDETDEEITIITEAMGAVIVKKEFVAPKEEEAPADDGPKWERSASLGYTQAGGNTEKSQGTFNIRANRKTDRDEWTVKGDAYYSSADKKMDAKKFYAMTRYAFSFGEKKKWYNFYKVEGDQDRFANIDYRIIPSLGVGYWFADKERFKAMAEGAVGYEYTSYRDNTDSDSEVILVPRGYVEKTFFKDLKVSQDVVMYPSLSEFGEYRLRSETAVINPISDRLSWKVSFIDEFNSEPSGTVKKNDYRLISAVDYAF